MLRRKEIWQRFLRACVVSMILLSSAFLVGEFVERGRDVEATGGGYDVPPQYDDFNVMTNPGSDLVVYDFNKHTGTMVWDSSPYNNSGIRKAASISCKAGSKSSATCVVNRVLFDNIADKYGDISGWVFRWDDDNTSHYFPNGRIRTIRYYNESKNAGNWSIPYSSEDELYFIDDGKRTNFTENESFTLLYYGDPDGPVWTSDVRNGWGLKFDGVDDYVETDLKYYDLENTFKIDCVVFPMGVKSSDSAPFFVKKPSTEQVIFSGPFDTNGNPIIYLSLIGDDSKNYVDKMRVKFQCITNSGSVNIVTDEVISVGEWSRITATYNSSGSIKIFVNGILKGSVDNPSLSSLKVPDEYRFYLGATPYTGTNNLPMEKNFFGIMDDFVLSRDDAPPKVMIAHWDFDELGGLELTDKSGNGVNGVLEGMIVGVAGNGSNRTVLLDENLSAYENGSFVDWTLEIINSEIKDLEEPDLVRIMKDYPNVGEKRRIVDFNVSNGNGTVRVEEPFPSDLYIKNSSSERGFSLPVDYPKYGWHNGYVYRAHYVITPENYGVATSGNRSMLNSTDFHRRENNYFVGWYLEILSGENKGLSRKVVGYTYDNTTGMGRIRVSPAFPYPIKPSTRYHLTLLYVPGKYGGAFNFNRSLNETEIIAYRIPYENATAIRTDMFSCEAWIMVEEFKTVDTFIINNIGWVMGVGLDKRFFCHVKSDSGVAYVYSTVSLEEGRWYHVGASYDKHEIKLYVNGEVVGRQTYSGTISYTPDGKPTYIGGGGLEVGGYFCGIIDDLRIYNYPREIKGEMVNLRFDEGAGNICEDSSPKLTPGIIGGDLPPTWCDGKYKSALDFNGQGIVDVGDKNSAFLYPFEQISLEAWIKDFDRDSSGVKTIVSVDSYMFSRVVARLSVVGAHIIRFEIYDNGRSWHALYYDLSDYNATHWYHVAGTFDGYYMRIYVNGVMKEKSDLLSSGAPLLVLSGPSHISIGGRWGSGGNSVIDGFYGVIDEVKVVNYPKCFREDPEGDGMCEVYEIMRSTKSDEFRPDEHNDRFALMVGTLNDNNDAGNENYVNEFQYIYDLYWMRMYLKAAGYRDDHIIWLTSLRPESNGGETGSGWTSYPSWYDGDAWKENLEKAFRGFKSGGYQRMISPPKEYLPNLTMENGVINYTPETSDDKVPIFFYDVYPYGGELKRMYVERVKATDILYIELRDHGDRGAFKMYRYKYYEIKEETPQGVVYHRFEGDINSLSVEELRDLEWNVSAKYLIDLYDFCYSGSFGWEKEIMMRNGEGEEFNSAGRIEDHGGIVELEHPSIVRWNETIVYLAFEGRNESGVRNIYVRKSTDGGNTFSQPVNVSTYLSGYSHYRPKVVVDSNGYIHVVWLAKKSNVTTEWVRIEYARSGSSHSLSFTIHQTIDAFNYSTVLTYPMESEPRIDVSEGKVVITWTRPASSIFNKWRTYYRLSSTNGNSFNAMQILPGQTTSNYTSYCYPTTMFYSFDGYLYLHFVHCSLNSTTGESELLWGVYNYSGGRWYDSAILENGTGCLYRNPDLSSDNGDGGEVVLVYEGVDKGDGRVGIYFRGCSVGYNASGVVDYYWWGSSYCISNETDYAVRPAISRHPGGSAYSTLYYVVYQSYTKTMLGGDLPVYCTVYKEVRSCGILPTITVSQPLILSEEHSQISHENPSVSTYVGGGEVYISIVWDITFSYRGLPNQMILTSTGESVSYRYNYLFYGRVGGDVYAGFVLRDKVLSDGKKPITTENAVWFPLYTGWDSKVCDWNRTADGIRLGVRALSCGWGWKGDGMIGVEWGEGDGIISIQEAHLLGAYASYMKSGVRAHLLLSYESKISHELYL